MEQKLERKAIPFQNYVLKIHSRCNLRCDYCYVYTMADQGWRTRPRAMPRAVIDRTASRIAEHAAAHGLRETGVVLHGGEPLLAGLDTIEYAVRALRSALDGLGHVTIDMQTNGLLLDDEAAERLSALDVGIGLSLDGDRAMHDRHRRGPGGQGSYGAVAAAASRMARYPGLFRGFLSVIDLRNDPVAAYESLLGFGPPAVDFLLPHGTWSAPPPGRPDDSSAPYGAWLAAVFDRWYRAPEKETGVRLFEEIVNLLLGGASATERVGTSPSATIVVETDGGLHWSEMLTPAFPGAGATGRTVSDGPLDALLRSPEAASWQHRSRTLARECRRCPVSRVCGGGLFEHRYRNGSGFDNPSVYCPDLYHLIAHIRARVAADLVPSGAGTA